MASTGIVLLGRMYCWNVSLSVQTGGLQVIVNDLVAVVDRDVGGRVRQVV